MKDQLRVARNFGANKDKRVAKIKNCLDKTRDWLSSDLAIIVNLAKDTTWLSLTN